MTIRRYGEGSTADGQLIRFTTPDEDVEEAKTFLKEHFSIVELPVTHTTNVEHGGYGRYSRFDIEQLEYWAGPTGYYEVLDIKDAPDGHHPYVSHSYHSDSEYGPISYFIEWESTEAAQASLKKIGAPTEMSRYTEAETPIPGLLRAVEVNYLTPWFYASGNAEIMGDYVFPEQLANDPVYQPGRRFLVPITKKWANEVDYTALKTCMGAITREVQPKRDSWGFSTGDTAPYSEKTIQWSDGSISRVNPKMSQSLMPRAVDSEPWVAEAVDKIQHMLSGRALNFTVDFADGGKFVGKFVEAKEQVSDVEGDYLLTVSFADGTVQEGWVNGFKPTPEAPSITAKALQVYKNRGQEVSHIEIKDRKTEPGGKKWKGVYYNRQTQVSDSPQSRTDEQLAE